MVRALPLSFDRLVATAPLSSRALQFAMRFGHPTHDCFSVALAEDASAPLVTDDQRMLDLAKQAGLGKLAKALAAFERRSKSFGAAVAPTRIRGDHRSHPGKTCPGHGVTMDILHAVKGRRSIRRFKNTPLPPHLLPTLEESLLAAPSAGNLQSRRFYFVFRDETRGRIAKAAYHQDFIREAPLAVVCCANLNIGRHYGERGRSLYCLQDVAASVQNLMLVAYSLGLGTVWVGAFDEKEVAKILSLPESIRPVAIVPVGYPDEDPSTPERIGRDQAVFYLR